MELVDNVKMQEDSSENAFNHALGALPGSGVCRRMQDEDVKAFEEWIRAGPLPMAEIGRGNVQIGESYTAPSTPALPTGTALLYKHPALITIDGSCESNLESERFQRKNHPKRSVATQERARLNEKNRFSLPGDGICKVISTNFSASDPHAPTRTLAAAPFAGCERKLEDFVEVLKMVIAVSRVSIESALRAKTLASKVMQVARTAMQTGARGRPAPKRRTGLRQNNANSCRLSSRCQRNLNHERNFKCETNNSERNSKFPRSDAKAAVHDGTASSKDGLEQSPEKQGQAKRVASKQIYDEVHVGKKRMRYTTKTDPSIIKKDRFVVAKDEEVGMKKECLSA